MRKLTILVLLTAVLAVLPLTAQNRLSVWTFTDEVQKMAEDYYAVEHPDVTVNVAITATEKFPDRLDKALATGRNVPDVVALEDSFVRRYVESGNLLDITDVYNKIKDKVLDYPCQVGMYNGRCYALSWQATPGAMFYRRSLAKKYLGTDDPEEVQKYFADMESFLETAKILKDKSNGVCSVVYSRGDLYKPFMGMRKDPWVVNGKVTVDPAVLDYMRTVQEMESKGYIVPNNQGQWSAGWLAGMNGTVNDANGNSAEVFSYFLPTWGLHYTLKPNASKTSGDWAMIPGPAKYRWGGTWLAAPKNTPDAGLAKAFIEYVTSDDDFLTKWADDTGDFVSNINVLNAIKGNYSEPFLKEQNHYKIFADMAEKVDGRLTQASDQVLDALFASTEWLAVKYGIDNATYAASFQKLGNKVLDGMEVEDAVHEYTALVTPPPVHLIAWGDANDEQIKWIIQSYSAANPNVTADLNFTQRDAYIRKLDSQLSAGTAVADIVAMNDEYLRTYVENGSLLDLTDIYNETKDDLYQFPAQIGTYNGRCYAFSLNACPGVMFYRRSLAKKYLGTDDPEKVQQYVADFGKFIKTAERLNKKSKGKCKIVGTAYELQRVFNGSRTSPWVKNGTINIDPKMKEYMAISKELIENKYVTTNAYPWSQEWFDSMNGKLKDQDGKKAEVFAYFLQAWDAKWLLEKNAPKTAGDWGVVEGPAHFYGSQAYIAVPKNTKNADTVKGIIRHMLLNKDFLKNWGVDDLTIMANKAVSQERNNNEPTPFFKKQNPYPVANRAAEATDASFVQSTDRTILNAFQKAVDDYVWQGKSMDQALADFIQSVDGTY